MKIPPHWGERYVWLSYCKNKVSSDPKRYDEKAVAKETGLEEISIESKEHE